MGFEGNYKDQKASGLSAQEQSQADINLKKLVAQSPVAMALLTGPSFVIEVANEKALELWRKKAKEVIGIPAIEAFPELESQGFGEILSSVYYKGEVFKANEMPIELVRHSKSETLFINFTYQPLIDSRNNTIGIMAVGNDVTEQVHNRQLIQDSEQKYKTLFESMNQAFCLIEVIFDKKNKPVDYRFLEINKPFENQTGLLNAAGKTARELVPDLEERWFEMYGKVALTGETLRFTEGSQAMGRWFDVQASKVGNENGKKVAILFTDITDNKKTEHILKESEQRFRELADRSPMFIFIVEPNADATISYWNKGWLDYTGQTFQEALGRAWNGILHPDDVPGVLDLYLQAFAARKPYYLPAVRVRRHDGVYRWHMFKGNPRFLAGGEFMGYVGVGFDIHEQKIAQEELKEFAEKLEALVEYRTRELERSNEDLQQFAHVASHDLKEPVRKIRTYTNMLKADFGEGIPERGKNFINKILSAADRLKIMIDGVLAYSSANASEQPIAMIDLNTIIKNVLTDLEVPISQKKGIINFEELPKIEGATVLIYQLFYNLINNALKFTLPSQPPVITITGKMSGTGNAEFAEIKVSDNGIGFEEEDANKIFETFTRLNSKDKFEGTGLGLSLCKKIAERHSGTISANGKLNKGATFTVILPARQKKDHI